VTRQEKTKAVKMVMKTNIEGKRGKKKQKKRWLDTIDNDMRAVGVGVREVENRDKWRFRTMMADPKYLEGR